MKSKRISKIQPTHAEIEIMYVSKKAQDDDTSLAPYVGYEVIVITQPDGSMDYVLDGEIYYNEAERLEYFQDEPIE